MSNLKYWQDKIKEKRSKTEFRDFTKEILSWTQLIFYKNKGMISKFSESSRINICKVDDFNKNRDDLTKNGLEYNFSKSFFENFKVLFRTTNFPALFHYGNSINSDFSDVTLSSKNVYLSNIVINECENIFYSFIIRGGCKNIFNCLSIVDNCINIYLSKGIISSYKVFYSSFIKNSSDIWFSSNLTGCKECIFCDDLQNVNYSIDNKKYTKEDYLEEKDKILSNKDIFLDSYKKVNTSGKNYLNSNVSGNFILESENIFNGNYINNTKNARNVIFVWSQQGNENFLDAGPAGGGGGDNFYAVTGAGNGSNNLYCSSQIAASSNIFYSYFLESCSYCIGCIGLINKHYCILNKEYTKEEWEILSDQIFKVMEKEKILGDFFPGNLNPFYFNDTLAYMMNDSFTKQEVEKRGYMWRDDKIKIDISAGSEVINTRDLDKFQGFNKEGKWKINPEILKKVIKDEKGNYYRIVQMEYDFLMKHELPLPEIHWIDRMKMNFGV